MIRFGLGAVKGVGQSAVESVLEVRGADGPFTGLYEFCRRVDGQKCNRRVVEALIKGGAFDSMTEGDKPLHRAQLTAALDTAMERAAQEQRDRRSGQTSLFGLLQPEPAPGGAPAAETYPSVPEWSHKALLAFEKEALGFYISGHPLDRYRADLSRYASATTIDFVEGGRGPGEAAIGGVVAAYRERPTKRGDGKMAFFNLEDIYGQIEVVVFPKTFEKVRPVLVSDDPILASGKVVDEGEGGQHAWRLLLEDAVPLAELRRAKTHRVELHINADLATPQQIEALRGLLTQARGGCQTVLRLEVPRRAEVVIPLGESWNVAPTDELLAGLERLFGGRVARLC